MTTVLITGANRGLGLGFVKHYLKNGNTVIATCREPENARDLSALSNQHPDTLSIIALNVSDDKSIAQFKATLSDTPIDLYINNAGIYGPKDGVSHVLGGCNYDQWRQVMEVNVLAAMKMVETLIDNLRAGKDKKIVVLSSKMGSMTDNTSGGSYLYRSSKAAVNAVMKSLAEDLRDEHFSVASFHPGWVRTDMGGPNGLIDIDESIAGMTRVIAQLTPDNSGQFWNYDGSHIGW